MIFNKMVPKLKSNIKLNDEELSNINEFKFFKLFFLILG